MHRDATIVLATSDLLAANVLLAGTPILSAHTIFTHGDLALCSPTADPGTPVTARASGESPRQNSGSERRHRQGRLEGTGRHPRAHNPIHLRPNRAAQVGPASRTADPHGQQQSFTWWSGATSARGTASPRLDARDTGGRDQWQLTPRRIWIGRPALSAAHLSQGAILLRRFLSLSPSALLAASRSCRLPDNTRPRAPSHYRRVPLVRPLPNGSGGVTCRRPLDVCSQTRAARSTSPRRTGSRHSRGERGRTRSGVQTRRTE